MKKVNLQFWHFFMLILTGCIVNEDIGLNSKLEINWNGEFLEVKDQKTLDSILTFLSKNDEVYLTKWEKNYGIRSLRESFANALVEEDFFLNEAVNKYGNDPLITREKLGYSDYTSRLLSKNALIKDDDVLLDMNVTIPLYSSLVNEQRIIKIGSQIYQFNRNDIKIIKDGDKGKISLLDKFNSSINSTTGNENIEILKVERKIQPFSPIQGKTNFVWNGSCDNTNQNYRVIGYEEDTYWANGCGSSWSYYIKVRSLRKILGTWQNYNTGSMKVKASCKINEWAVPKNSNDYGFIQPYIYRQIVDWTNITFDLSYGHTGYKYIVLNTPTMCQVYPTQQYEPLWKVYRRFYTVYGYNSSSCSFGADPYEQIFMTTSNYPAALVP